MSDDDLDELEYIDRDTDRESDPRCRECGQETVGESCGFCGNDLCPMCFECGAGFCSATHTQEQIDAYEDAAYPPANEQEAQSRKRHRAARDDLKRLWILP